MRHHGSKKKKIKYNIILCGIKEYKKLKKIQSKNKNKKI